MEDDDRTHRKADKGDRATSEGGQGSELPA